jgi:hypothetical protein
MQHIHRGGQQPIDPTPSLLAGKKYICSPKFASPLSKVKLYQCHEYNPPKLFGSGMLRVFAGRQRIGSGIRSPC